jgi:hypothetical protein
MGQVVKEVTVDTPEHTTMYLRQAGLTRNPTFSYLYSVRCRGQDAVSKSPLERKYSRWAQAVRDILQLTELNSKSRFQNHGGL